MLKNLGKSALKFFWRYFFRDTLPHSAMIADLKDF